MGAYVNYVLVLVCWNTARDVIWYVFAYSNAHTGLLYFVCPQFSLVYAYWRWILFCHVTECRSFFYNFINSVFFIVSGTVGPRLIARPDWSGSSLLPLSVTFSLQTIFFIVSVTVGPRLIARLDWSGSYFLLLSVLFSQRIALFFLPTISYF